MNKRTDFPTLLLFTAFLFGIIVRFYPAIASGFPLNDGGMFFSMVQDLKANGSRLPDFTTYNQADIPFAYPPFGFYIAALLSTLIPDSDLIIFLYLPAFVNSLSIVAFYLFAKELLQSRMDSATATLFFALTPAFFVWQVMGGGITRAFGFMFQLLTVWQALLLFKESQRKHLLPAILFGAVAVTSHPQTALHTAVGCALLVLYYGRNKRGFIHALIFAIGVTVLSAPWWATVLTRHGIEPFLSAGNSSPRTWDAYLELLKIDLFFAPVMLLALLGIFDTQRPLREKAFLLSWTFLLMVIDPRGNGGMPLLTSVLLAGWGLSKLSTWKWSKVGTQAQTEVWSRFSLGVMFVASMILLLRSIISDFQLINTSLEKEDLEVITWVQENLPKGERFALATGIQYSMSDPLQEWFPALTGHQSLTTMQGLEWVLADDFFKYYEQTSAFQQCMDAACLKAWTMRNEEYNYLLVLIPKETAMDSEALSLRSLGVSIRESDSHTLIFESEHALIFEYKK